MANPFPDYQTLQRILAEQEAAQQAAANAKLATNPSLRTAGPNFGVQPQAQLPPHKLPSFVGKGVPAMVERGGTFSGGPSGFMSNVSKPVVEAGNTAVGRAQGAIGSAGRAAAPYIEKAASGVGQLARGAGGIARGSLPMMFMGEGMKNTDAAHNLGIYYGDEVGKMLMGDAYTEPNPYSGTFAGRSAPQEPANPSDEYPGEFMDIYPPQKEGPPSDGSAALTALASPSSLSSVRESEPFEGMRRAGPFLPPGYEVGGSKTGPGGYGDKRQYAGAPTPPEFQGGGGGEPPLDPSAPMFVPTGNPDVPATDDSAQAAVLAGQQPDGQTAKKVERQLIEGATKDPLKREASDQSVDTLAALGNNRTPYQPKDKGGFWRGINRYLAAASGPNWDWNRLDNQDYDAWLKQNQLSEREKTGVDTARSDVEGTQRFNDAAALQNEAAGGMSPQQAQLYSMIVQDYLGGQQHGRTMEAEKQRGENAVATATARAKDPEVEVRTKFPWLFPKYFPDMDPNSLSAVLQGKAGGGLGAQMDAVRQALQGKFAGAAGAGGNPNAGTSPLKIPAKK